MLRFLSSTRRAVYGLGLAALLAVPVAAQNQQSPVTDQQASGSWTVRCYRVQGLPCDISQSTVDRARKVVIASVSIAYIPKSNAYFGRFVLPLGVSFDQGMGLQIGEFRAASLKFRICERDGCYVTGILPPAMIEAMQAGGKGEINAALVDGRKFKLPIVLDGFSDGLDVLKKWAVAKPSGGSPKK